MPFSRPLWWPENWGWRGYGRAHLRGAPLSLPRGWRRAPAVQVTSRPWDASAQLGFPGVSAAHSGPIAQAAVSFHCAGQPPAPASVQSVYRGDPPCAGHTSSHPRGPALGSVYGHEAPCLAPPLCEKEILSLIWLEFERGQTMGSFSAFHCCPRCVVLCSVHI